MEKQDLLTDRFGRKHEYLRISLTERCNLRCFYCMPAEGIPLRHSSSYMTAAEIFQMAQAFAGMGIKKIRLTGGEPLVRKDAAQIMELLASLPVEIAVTTNGILADEFIGVFRKTGIRNINVSLDSLQPDKLARITRREHFGRITSNIRLLKNEGFRLKINTVLIRGMNDDEIIDFILWSAEEDLSVRFIEFMPFNGNAWEWKKGIPFTEIMNVAVRAFGKENILKCDDGINDTSRNFRLAGRKGGFAVITSVTNPFCDTCNRIRLTADGRIKNCLFSGGETDLLTPLRNGKDIRPLITNSVLNKKKIRGGMETFRDFSDPSRNSLNRSMIAIGG